MKIKIKKPRTIVSIGYSFLITLPKIWLDNNNLNKGDKIYFEIDNNKNLILKPEEQK